MEAANQSVKLATRVWCPRALAALSRTHEKIKKLYSARSRCNMRTGIMIGQDRLAKQYRKLCRRHLCIILSGSYLTDAEE